MITNYLQEWREGDPQALERLTTAIYSELRRMAAGILGGRESATVQPTALVHDLYLQLPTLQHVDWTSRAQFFNIVARVMRNIAVDYARKRRASKRGGDVTVVALEDFDAEAAGKGGTSRLLDLLLVNELLDELGRDYPRHAHVVELKFFGGLTDGQTAEVIRAGGDESSERTVARDWSFAKAWMRTRVSSSEGR